MQSFVVPLIFIGSVFLIALLFFVGSKVSEYVKDKNLQKKYPQANVNEMKQYLLLEKLGSLGLMDPDAKIRVEKILNQSGVEQEDDSDS